MAGLITLSLMAAQLGAAQPAAPASADSRRAVSASARATVRILPGAKVNLSGQAEAQGYRLSSATITAEDGRQLSAKLVEFQ
jgi:hypothetical protein